jgi:hypothetical protein
MSAIAEGKTRVSESRIIIGTDEKFVLIKASELTLKDEFMQFKPKTVNEQILKKMLTDAINEGVNDFYRARMDPSINSAGNIYYSKGKKPAAGKSYAWWINQARCYNRKCNSRLATVNEYVAFLGVFMGELLRYRHGIEEVWNLVCNDSKDMGHYINSREAKGKLELTGSRLCNFIFDIGNTRKILAKDEDEFCLAGGSYNQNSYYFPLSIINHMEEQHGYVSCNDSVICENSTGFVILDKIA